MYFIHIIINQNDQNLVAYKVTVKLVKTSASPIKVKKEKH